ncbi:MAG: ABC-type bacteriocin/lantibiotic exporter with N-terminal double-glycine peptidase domain [Gemmatimonadetes bacterium]|nr:ABC-type bacteriocin/lantibiotic exporter with N-terminal double-glycine peptidase domain [Gemmatimonadota bacterium]
MQMSAVECGVACLAMVCQAHGVRATLPDCRARLGTGRDGVNALALVEAGRAFGFRVKAYAARSRAAVEQLPLPAVAHWGVDHWVVLEGWSPDGDVVEVVDPAVGRRRLTWDAFLVGCSGTVLAFDPPATASVAAAPSSAASAGPLRALLRRPDARRALTAAGAASILMALAAAVPPLLARTVVDGGLDALAVEPRRSLGWFAAVALAAALAHVALGFARTRLLAAAQARLDAELSDELMRRLLGLPRSYFQAHAAGDLVERAVGGGTLRQALAGGTVAVLMDGAAAGVPLAATILLSPALGLVALAAAALLLGLVAAAQPSFATLARREAALRAEQAGEAADLVAGVETVKAAGAEGAAAERWNARFRRRLLDAAGDGNLLAGTQAAVSAVRWLGAVAVLWAGARMALGGGVSLGTAIAAAWLAAAALGSLAALAAAGQRLHLALAQARRMMDVPGSESNAAFAPDLARSVLAGAVEARGLGFRHGAEGPWVLRAVSFVVQPGRSIAIVGPSGCGKSTLAALLLGLEKPAEGEVLYDGIPLGELGPGHLRRQVGAVPQGAALFRGTVRDNLALTSPDASAERLAEAARAAGVHHEIAALPLGYETRLMDGGAGLSAGQRQRLVLARALVAHPAVLVLDDATSHLDAGAERGIHRRLAALGCTRVVIGGRAAAACEADEILVLDAGGVAERGTHAELLAAGGTYARLLGVSDPIDAVLSSSKPINGTR